jgi:hydroxymethylbilane synthase
MTPVYIGTRGSPLALWQAHHIAERLQPLAAARPVELVIIQTQGDLVTDRPLAAIGGEGLFTKEIQRALLDGRADVAVHSLKDLPTLPVEGLVLAAVPERGPTGDAFVSTRHARFDDLPRGAVVASGSLRRKAQILHRRPDLTLPDLRGNVETRLRKLGEQHLDGIILAQAGLERLGRDGVITEILDPAWMLPAVGQGALGLECRADDAATQDLLAALDHPPTRRAVLAERALLLALGGGCQVPLGAHARVFEATLHLRGALLSADGRRRVAGEEAGPAAAAEDIGRALATKLRAMGAAELVPPPGP